MISRHYNKIYLEVLFSIFIEQGSNTWMKNLNPWAKNNKTVKIERKRREKEEHEKKEQEEAEEKKKEEQHPKERSREGIKGKYQQLVKLSF